jgi:predicted enzyme related to lactoylglutathione lyase
VPDAEWRKGSILYFLVDDINVAVSLLAERGVHFQGAPHLIFRHDDTGVEEWMAFFDDPDGNTIGLMSLVRPSEDIPRAA